MHYYIITGASRGLGRALAEEVLKQPDAHVLGVSRHATIEHPRYQHQPLDLSDIVAVQNNLYKLFPARPDASSLTLVNNAGVMGEISYAGELPNEHYEFVFDVNVIAPAMLMNTFLSAYGGLACPRTVLNISSGAGQRPVDGWGAYCASKAALDMLSQVAQKEQDQRGRGVRIRSLAPGTIDTDMQAHIRAADEGSFSEQERFRGLHREQALAHPDKVAGRIVRWLAAPAQMSPSVVLRITDLE
ncbi:SDR family NAD(P)-dependent oxidoreductase [Hymenobacter sp. 15J16-1T3B]|uniref:SDR family NAD(P)-dependent oxidoreductase n=1 Tax=Hymenobacter sp. 15J16-1T3B TaxID=2886941 RepID=UPI001D115B06|nr:SDR family NAD(P)-dependent oxidoreductase [Hymenobacter sp. 15J16-1T3B]MCC3157288.1 SDR family NAD(P)-dependent oxidoreductase [Hymenobacter sp. 15J16-1T3B]